MGYLDYDNKVVINFGLVQFKLVKNYFTLRLLLLHVHLLCLNLYKNGLRLWIKDRVSDIYD